MVQIKNDLPPSNDVEVTINVEYPSYSIENEETVFINCGLRAPDCPDTDRQPVDLVVVLDRSGSMSGSKLQLCKKTIEFLIKELSSKDRFSLVTYDTNVSTNIRLTKMDKSGKNLVETVLSQLHAGSSTNLSGGLLAGIQEIQNSKRSDNEPPNPVRSLMILTDGLANHGITDTPSIIKMLEGSLDPKVTIFTFGYGSDHNADMLREISQVGRGVYYFVQNLDGVTLAFADCLGGLLSVVAQSMKLECIALNETRILSIKTRKEFTTIAPKQHFEIDMGDLYGEEQRDILIEVALPKIPTENKEFGAIEFRLNYANVLTSRLDKKESTAIVSRLEIVTEKDRVPNSAICQQKNRILAAEAIERSNEQAKSGKYEEGRKELEEAMTKITKTISVLNVDDEEGTQALLSDLNECKGTIANANIFRDRGQYFLANKGQSHWCQRSNDVELTQDHVSFGTEAGVAAPAAPSARGYRTKKKAGMLSSVFGVKK